jgi:hypothetical protein
MTSTKTEYVTGFSSALVWTTLALVESGVPLSRSRLLDRKCEMRVDRCNAVARANGFALESTGALVDLRALMKEALLKYPAIGEHPIWSLTDTGLMPTSRLQRLLVQEHLPLGSDLRRRLTLVNRHHLARDTRSRYTSKLLARGLPVSPGAIIVYPHWHPTPSPYRGSTDAEGGSVSRLSASDPPVQQFPWEVKKCMGSRYEGGYIMAVDASQIELRTGAIHSGDPFLLRAYRENTDLHSALAVKVFGPGCKDHPHWMTGDNRRDPRQPGKTIRFQTFYGGGAPMAQEQLLKRGDLLMPLDQVQTIVDTVREEEAVWFAWANEFVRKHRKRGIIRLPLTHQVRHLDLTNPEIKKRQTAEREAVNFPIQAEASNTIVSVSWWMLQNLPPKVHYCLSEHDKMVFDCPPEVARGHMRDLISAAFAHEQTSGHWARLQDHYGHECPLEYGVEVWS